MLFSFFIYFEAFFFQSKLLNSFVGIVAIYFFLKERQRAAFFWIGFFIALLWFYWIGNSLKYYNLPFWGGFLVDFLIAFVYGMIFFGFVFFERFFENRFFYRALFLLLLSEIKPFGFDWLVPEAMFAASFFKVDKISFLFILFAVALVAKKKDYILFSLIVLAFCVEFTKEKKLPVEDIFLCTTKVPQEMKWKSSYLNKTVLQNIACIERAIKEGKKMVVLPESAFALYLNKDIALMEELKRLSKKILIVSGALYYEKNKHFNSAYIFKDGNVTVAKKVILVPFGEEVPLFSPLDKYVNKIFFGGASDFDKAKDFTFFFFKKTKCQIAICYEATAKKTYLSDAKVIVALSNNGWFVPSIEPVLQNLLIKYYARRFGKAVYHSCNMSQSKSFPL